MIEYLFTPYILAGVILATAITIYNRLRANPALPDLPWLNTREGELFTRLRARFRSTLNYKQTVHQAYEQVTSPTLVSWPLELTTTVLREGPVLYHTRYQWC